MSAIKHKVLTHYDSRRAMRTTLRKHNIALPLPTPTHLDWNKDELDVAISHDLAYTLRSSKFPRTLNHPTRITLTLNDTHTWTLHKILLKTLSTTLSKPLTTNPTLRALEIRAAYPISHLPSWTIFFEWLYTLDKTPLQDYTPLRRPHWQTLDLKNALFLSSFLRAPKFEKYLLRIVHKEIWDGGIWSEGDLRHVGTCMGRFTGTWHFLRAYHRWEGSGRVGELDPYRWRIEHWYSICGTVSNWGCFHAMNVSGWGGVWERQRARGGEYEGEWMDEIVFDDPAEGDAFWGCDVTETLLDGGEGGMGAALAIEDGLGDDGWVMEGVEDWDYVV